MFRAILIFLIIVFIHIASSSADEIKCNESGTQLELNACAHDEFVRADKALNQAYQALLKKEAKNKPFIRKLKVAQRAWVVFRDADIEARFACDKENIRFCWGSMYPMLLLFRKAELTRERTKHLQQILKVGIGQ